MRLNRRIVRFFLALLFALMSSGAYSQDAKVRIGVSIPLTGPAANYGDDIKRTLIFANKELYGNRFDFVFEDDTCDPKEAVSVAHKFVDIDKIGYVTGFACSGALLAAAPIYERAKVLAIGILTTSPKLSDAGQFIYRTAPGDRIAAATLTNYIDRQYKHLAVVTEETEYCETLLQEIGKAMPQNLLSEKYRTGETDFRTLLLRIKSKSPDVVWLNTQSDEPLITLVKQLKSLKWDIPIFGAYYPGSSAFLKAVGPLANGITYVDLPMSRDLISRDKAGLYDRFLKEGGPLQGVDETFVLAANALAAFNGAIKPGQDVKKNLDTLTFDGVAGPFQFNKDGDIEGAKFVIKRIVDGVPTLITNSD